MKFLRDLINRQSATPETASDRSDPFDAFDSPEPNSDDQAAQSLLDDLRGIDAAEDNRAEALDEDTSAALDTSSSEAPSAAQANIWDLDDDVPSSDEIAFRKVAETPAPVPMAEPTPSVARPSSRKRRTKTRLIGFDKSDGEVVDLFDGAQKAAPALRVKFPVGWVVVVEGPGRGECFTLVAGMSQIGRGEDQAIQLDFGDTAISRNNHAAIVYDPESRGFLLGHGGKANIVRLNDTPVITNEALKHGDVIRLGETKLRLVTFCGEDFDWNDTKGEEQEDVAIA